MMPSPDERTVLSRLSAGRLSLTADPMVPPGTSANVNNAPAYIIPTWFTFGSKGMRSRTRPRSAWSTTIPVRSRNGIVFQLPRVIRSASKVVMGPIVARPRVNARHRTDDVRTSRS